MLGYIKGIVSIPRPHHMSILCKQQLMEIVASISSFIIKVLFSAEDSSVLGVAISCIPEILMSAILVSILLL